MRRIVLALSLVAAAAGAALTFAPRSGRADDVPAPASKAVDLENTTCPVKGKPVAPGITAEVDGQIVHFCCAECAKAYRADPAAYQAALRKDPAVAHRMGMAEIDDSAPAAGRELHDAMRKLWEDHVWWTRLFVVSATSNLPDKDATTQRLLKNQTDLGDAIKPYYGDEAGTKLTALLRDHILIASDVVTASSAKDDAKAKEATQRWFANADEIAAFLSAANPSAWPAADMKKMMREHLELTTEEVKARLERRWDADIAAWEKVRDQALHMADLLSDGIARQFPDKVR